MGPPLPNSYIKQHKVSERRRRAGNAHGANSGHTAITQPPTQRKVGR